MSKLYLATGTDTYSDDGHWEIIVSAETRAKARRLVAQALKGRGRFADDELTWDNLEILASEISANGVIYNTTEVKR